jgi:colanic acid biosynthesis protein WcaH
MNTSAYRPDPSVFGLIVRHTPLISIDLLVYNQHNEVLLGLRKNQPARDSWFVPGGRILKDESIRDAFSRIALAETGIRVSIERANFHGVYEHFHPGDNFLGDPEFGTHYIVLAFELKPDDPLRIVPDSQHDNYRWVPVDELLNDPAVHRYVKNYFNGTVTF